MSYLGIDCCDIFFIKKLRFWIDNKNLEEFLRGEKSTLKAFRSVCTVLHISVQ